MLTDPPPRDLSFDFRPAFHPPGQPRENWTSAERIFGATPLETGRIVGCERGWRAARRGPGRTARGAAPPVAGSARPEPGTAGSPARRVLRHGEPLGDRADPDVRAGPPGPRRLRGPGRF